MRNARNALEQRRRRRRRRCRSLSLPHLQVGSLSTVYMYADDAYQYDIFVTIFLRRIISLNYVKNTAWLRRKIFLRPRTIS